MILLSLALGWSASRDLQSARRELAAVTKANDFLKKTLSDMTIAISAKDREIDRLQQSNCPGGQEKAQPATPMRPRRNKVSESGRVPPIIKLGFLKPERRSCRARMGFG
jgi:hypothetical protein